VFYRSLGFASLLLLAALQTGCCSSPCGKGMGCGRTYWGAYADDPPTCEPCDKCGNFTGGNKTCKKNCNSCADDCEFSWARGTRVTLLGGLFNCDMFNGGGKQSCTAGPSCGEPSCAEPGCGYESAPATASYYSTPHATNVSYASNDNWSPAGSSKPCNCGKKH
jgi:hypothetical protein